MNILSTFTGRLIREFTEKGRFRTARAYASALAKLSGFLEREACIGDISAEAVKSYELWMFAVGLAPNTISFYMRNLRAIYNKAVKAGVAAAASLNPFSDVYTGVAATAKRALDEADIQRLVAVLDRNGGKEKREERNALRLFLFCFFAQGMPFADAILLRKSIVKGKNAIVYMRRKTGKEVIVFITEPMRKIMNSFAAETRNSPYVFPFIKDVKDAEDEYRKYTVALTTQNRLLKAVCRTAGLKQPVSTHVARHSWASLAYCNNVSLAAISASLGHQNEKTTRIYLNRMNTGATALANQAIADIFYPKK
ncbi:MAG: site-specific integrase [Dysgonamonadaceae bacterium]|jgi:integrase|nr:site-specific integrase [Dysgonamonadaceae bacterium]